MRRKGRLKPSGIIFKTRIDPDADSEEDFEILGAQLTEESTGDKASML